jgi:hypothetical protein
MLITLILPALAIGGAITHGTQAVNGEGVAWQLLNV